MNATILVLVCVALALIAGFLLGRTTQRRRDPASPGAAPAPMTPIAAPLPPATQVAPATAQPKPASQPTLAASSAPVTPPARAQPASRTPAASPGAPAVTPATATSTPSFAAATSWGYQLQNLKLPRAAQSPFDVLVIDASKDGDDESALKPAEIARLQAKPDGSRRIVLAYLSIGEAESYRGYWKKDWARNKPAWLLGENPDWEENYSVCFWDPAWQALLCGNPGACLDRILAQGFDGIYLDKCDVIDDLQHHERKAAAARSDLDGDMVALVQNLAAYARARRPGFLVVMQNAEQLLERAPLRAALDGVAKEELVFGADQGEKPNSAEDVAWSVERLDLMRRDGKPVFVVEYLNDRAKVAKAADAIRAKGYVLFVSDKSRELNRLDYTTLEA